MTSPQPQLSTVQTQASPASPVNGKASTRAGEGTRRVGSRPIHSTPGTVLKLTRFAGQVAKAHATFVFFIQDSNPLGVS
jgi:hypothetical protein